MNSPGRPPRTEDRGADGRSSRIEQANDVAIRDAAFLRVTRVHAARFTAVQLSGAAVRSVIQLAVQPPFRLVRDHVQRPCPRERRAEPLRRLVPHRMARNIVTASFGGVSLTMPVSRNAS